MCAPGYYKSNYRALSIRGLARMRGWLRIALPLTYLISRFKKPTAASWMPQTWAELECTEQELSAEFFQAVEPYREALKRLGFTELGFKKVKRVLNPLNRETGGITFLDSSRRHFAQLLYVKIHVPPPISKDRKKTTITFTAVFREKTLSYTNNTTTPFDSVPTHEVVRISSEDAASIYQRFVERLKRHKEEPRSFPDLQSLQTWFDSQATEVFKYRVQKGYFIRMTDDEVAAVQGKMPPVI